jgi:hypothetical protein
MGASFLRLAAKRVDKKEIAVIAELSSQGVSNPFELRCFARIKRPYHSNTLLEESTCWSGREKVRV